MAAPYLMRKNILLPFRLVFDMVSDILNLTLEKKWVVIPPEIPFSAVFKPVSSQFSLVRVIHNKLFCF
ncbi:hypothetical protein DVG78_19345 [Runella aurantiaca]|uniref:Uncharacterized protein n=1 Tax=Runella aurantiaca TaxID=2282308 RepID=A0A369I9Z0_9BACT|nr:hypothetical protein DVG78_19345 [Runella aurantiaca]